MIFKIRTILVVALLTLGALPILAVPVQAVTTAPSYITIDLSSTDNTNDIPYGIDCSDADNVYMTIDTQGLLVKIDKSSKTPTILPDNNAVSGGENFYAIARDDSGNLFVNARDWGMVWRFSPSTSTWTAIPIVKQITHSTATYAFVGLGGGSGYSVHPTEVKFVTSTDGTHSHQFGFGTFAGVVFANSNIWTAAQYGGITLHAAEITDGVDTDPAVQAFHGLVKINPSTLAVTWIPISGASNLRGMEVDGNIIWLTDQTQDKIFKFDTTTETITATFTMASGSNPRELSLDSTFLYVALNKPTGGNLEFAKVDKLLGTVTTIDLGTTNTAGGTFATLVSGTTLAWSSESQKVGLWNLSTNTGISVSATTTTSNHFMCLVGSDVWIAGKGSAAVVVLALPEEGGGGGGGSYSPQSIPSVVFNSTGVGGQNNVYLAHNGQATITGFQWLYVGGSSGELSRIEVVVPTGSKSPSSGTFGSLTYSMPPVIEGGAICQYMTWLWFCKVVASPSVGISPSQTYSGIFCNNEYITKTSRECVGTGIPVSYQTFSYTFTDLPLGRTVIQIQAIGTAEPAWMIQAGYGTNNIIVDNNGT